MLYAGYRVTLTPYRSKGHHASLDTFMKACSILEKANLGKLSKGRAMIRIFKNLINNKSTN